MCGRFTLHTPREILSRRLGVALPTPSFDPRSSVPLDRQPAEPTLPGFESVAAETGADAFAPRYNIAPTQAVLTVHSGREGRVASFMRWGFVPFWAKQPGSLPQMINARSETAFSARAYRAAFERQRCWIAADGFYEWRAPPVEKGPKIPYWIALASGEPFAMAGLWSRWHPSGDRHSEPLLSCTILTTQANPTVAAIHPRMPVILHPEAEASWIDPGLDGEVERLRALLVPVPSDALTARPVSMRVNSARNDGPDLIAEHSDPREGFV
jgi:putative SOS response-associated peptidase YedK